ncbi:Nucleic-acid-binding protein from transposon X-element [Eumeta japonica]|uniref:Nucleic-acid-binding protein from transposon X-element n=1 Tax=Eumeta variegata TaxID=151549 RepID=A0A4C1ZZV9_EUMVA|nr:Nucleic-acid-binding protein from transposon X-element [Eumeta japonica]
MTVRSSHGSRRAAPKSDEYKFGTDKSKWNLAAAEGTKLRINYTKAQNTKFMIKITVASIEDFRNLNRYLIKNNLPFHTFALEEERKVKAVIKGIPVEIETQYVKEDLQRQGYPTVAVHKMHRRDGTALGLVLAILERSDRARAILKDLGNVCELSGIAVEPPYKKGMPGQCHSCQLYGHAAANCHAQPRCVKCLVPHWTKDCERKKEAGGKPSCCNCGQEHTANYKGCPVAPKPKPVNKINRSNQQTNKIINKNQFPTLGKSSYTNTRANNSKSSSAGGKDYRPAPYG